MLLVPVVDGRQTYGAAQVRYKYKPLIGRAVPRQTARGREQSLDRQRVLCMCVCVHCLYVYVFMYVHTCRHACMHYICSSSGLKYIIGFNIVLDLTNTKGDAPQEGIFPFLRQSATSSAQQAIGT